MHCTNTLSNNLLGLIRQLNKCRLASALDVLYLVVVLLKVHYDSLPVILNFTKINFELSFHSSLLHRAFFPSFVKTTPRFRHNAATKFFVKYVCLLITICNVHCSVMSNAYGYNGACGSRSFGLNLVRQFLENKSRLAKKYSIPITRLNTDSLPKLSSNERNHRK